MTSDTDQQRRCHLSMVDDVNDPNLKDTCFHGSGGAFGVVPSLVLSLAVLFSMWL